MLLIQRGEVKLDDPVCSYIPEFKGEGRELITVHELMTHTSGLPEDVETKTDWHGQAEAIKKACAAKLRTPPGTNFKYSDINFFLLVKSSDASAIPRWKFLCNARFMAR